MLKILSALVCFLGCVVTICAQEGDIRNPYTSPEDVVSGEKLFRAHCAVCHGLDGSGATEAGADLTKGEFRHGNSDAGLRETIFEGIPGTDMTGTFFEGRQLWQIVAYVRTLSQGPKSSTPSGDPARGKHLFHNKGGCSQCHKVGGTGGRLAPNLSDVGARRSSQYLRTSLLQPSDRILPQHWTLRAVTKQGQQISGVRLNEDSHSLQIRDGGDRLVTLLKSEIREYHMVKTSSMPSYAGRLSTEEIGDLVAYLSTLRRGSPK